MYGIKYITEKLCLFWEGDIIPITIFLYLIAGRYVLGSNKFSGITTKLSGATKGLTSGLFANPNRMENIIGLVRTAAPLTSSQTVSKFNTYLPIVEKISTLLGMYTFLNRAQNYAPIQSMNAKTPMEKVTALISSGNIPIGKMLAQPIIANNMDKIISSVAKDIIGPMISSGNLNGILSSVSKQFLNGNDPDSQDTTGNMDLSSLIDTFMPLMNNMMSDNSSNSDTAIQKEENSLPINETTDSNSDDLLNTPNNNDTSSVSNNIIQPKSNINRPIKQSNNIPLEIKPRSRKRKNY